MDKKKMILNVFVDNEVVIFDDLMPEGLKKHFKNMATTVNTLTQLTNHKEFNNIECMYVKDPNKKDQNKMLFKFDGDDLCININTSLKKEVLSFKEDLCFLRDSFLHSFIKQNNTVYIIESKPKNLTTITIKLYNTKGLIKEFLINSNIINAQKLYTFFREEKKLINNYFKYSNVTAYESLDNAHIIELRDRFKTYKINGVKELINKFNKPIESNKVEANEKIENYNLDELDELLYQTGLISVEDIKEELNKRNIKKETKKNMEEVK